MTATETRCWYCDVKTGHLNLGNTPGCNQPITFIPDYGPEAPIPTAEDGTELCHHNMQLASCRGITFHGGATDDGDC